MNYSSLPPDTTQDPIPGLVLIFYVFVFYLFFAASGCGGLTFKVGGLRQYPISPATPSYQTRGYVGGRQVLPADYPACPIEFRPWNSACNID